MKTSRTVLEKNIFCLEKILFIQVGPVWRVWIVLSNWAVGGFNGGPRSKLERGAPCLQTEPGSTINGHQDPLPLGGPGLTEFDKYQAPAFQDMIALVCVPV